MGEPTSCRERVPELNNHRNHFYHEWIRKEEDCILGSMGIEMRVDAGLRTDKENPFDVSRMNTPASRGSRRVRDVGVEADMPGRELARQSRVRERLNKGWGGVEQERFRSSSPFGRSRRTRPKHEEDLLSTRGEGREYWKWANHGTFSLGTCPNTPPRSLYRNDFKDELRESRVYKRPPSRTTDSRPASRAFSNATDPYSKIGKSPAISKNYYGMFNYGG